MSLALAGIGVVTVAAAVLAVSAREARAVVLGLLFVLLASALVADPWPGPLPIAARLAAAGLACRLIAISVRGEGLVTGGTRIGWPTEAVAAAAAWVVGYGTHGLGAAGTGPPEAQAAGFAVGILAVAPLVTGRDVLRLGIAAILLLVAALLVRAGLGGTPSELEQLVTSGLIAGLGGAIAVVVSGARAEGRLDTDDRPRPRGRAARPIRGSALGRPQPDGGEATTRRRLFRRDGRP